MADAPRLPDELSDLHIHVGGAVAPHILYSIAHTQGLKLPVKTYWEFVERITSSPEKVHNLEEYLAIMHETELIQSSPLAMERAVYEVIGKEYRSSRVGLIELRFNPMKRNLGGERDLDHIILATLVGMDRACLEYGVKAGLIFCLAREFDFRLNEIIVEKAIKYRNRGVIAIDLAGTETKSHELDTESVKRYAGLYAKARDAGLKTTIHTGETTNTNGEGVIAVIKHLKPDRIGHGIRAAYNEAAMDAVATAGVVLEICPTSNLHTHAVKDINELGHILNTFVDHKVKFTINTDGPYLLKTNMRQEVELLLEHKLLSTAQIATAFETARKATFVDFNR
jgi:adenosine deaminase